jgi:nitroimidazol reductase NimA-like FMN-containing flavoprotein (pyridoxamine 5'-phosphate oxidase superfamily)
MESIRDVHAGNVVLEDLSREECLAHLARTPVGRVGGVAHGRPFLFPVNYLLDGETVVFRTEPGTKLEGAGFGRVAFEIDGIDESAKLGWSVIVQGVGAEITEMIDDHSERLRELGVVPWAPGEKAHWVAIQAESITGKRIRRD